MQFIALFDIITIMDLILLGINHRSADLKTRERFTLTKKRINELYLLLGIHPHIFTLMERKYAVAPSPLVGEGRGEGYNSAIQELLLLSTCNRTEIYAVTNSPEKIKELLSVKLNITIPEEKYFYFLRNKNTVKHLFRVSAGLDSQILGENEILGQIKKAYYLAMQSGATGRYFNKLFQRVIAVGKMVRGKTKISEGNITIGSLALRILENPPFPPLLKGGKRGLEDKKILIVGAGEVGELVAKYLQNKGESVTFVANKNYDQAVKLATKIGGKAVHFDRLKSEVASSDIVISATSSPHIILKKDDILEIMSKRQNQTLIIMDLALPRDVDPEIKNIAGVILYNLDDLNFVIEKNYRNRIQEAEKAEKIVAEEAEKFWAEISKPESRLELEPVAVR